jgi:hypothetical protein
MDKGTKGVLLLILLIPIWALVVMALRTLFALPADHAL